MKTREQSKLSRRRYRAKHRRVTDRKYQHSDKGQEAQKRSQARVRQRVALARLDTLQFLGGKCSRCGFSDVRALQIDHINGGGSKELQSYRNSYRRMAYYEKVRQTPPGTYQILCANCNWIKMSENKEFPHAKRTTSATLHPPEVLPPLPSVSDLLHLDVLSTVEALRALPQSKVVFLRLEHP